MSAIRCEDQSLDAVVKVMLDQGVSPNFMDKVSMGFCSGATQYAVATYVIQNM